MAQGHQVARPCRAQRGTGDQALQVMHPLEQLAQFGAFCRAERKVLDRIKPVLDPRQRHKRPQEPRAEQPSPHRRDGAIQFVEQGSRTPAIHAFDHVEMAQCDRVDEQRVGGDAPRDVAYVRQVHTLRVTEVSDNCARRRRRRRGIVESVPRE